MITKEALHEAIAECQGTRNPNANTCFKLASYYTILDHMEDKSEEKEYAPEIRSYSYEARYTSDTEFSEACQMLSEYDVMAIMDELMGTLEVVNPRLYDSVMRKIKNRV